MVWLLKNRKHLTALILLVGSALVFPYPAFAGVFDSVGIAILEFAAFFTGLGANALDYAVAEYVIGMGEWFTKGGEGTKLSMAIDQTWSVVRDLMNIAFVFGLIYIGMKLIFNLSNQTGQIKRTLGLIIIAALLVNFSLFFAKFVIDIANITAAEIYNQSTPTIQTVSTGGVSTRKGTISEGFAHLMGIQGFFDGSTKSIEAIYGEEGLSLMYVLTGVVFLFIAAFVFAAGFLLLIARFVALVFLMVISPVAFGALAFPQTQKYALEWWHRLFSQAFFAPAFLFLAYVSLRVIEGMGIGNGAAPFAQVATGSTLDVSVVVAFAIASAFLIGSLFLAKQLGVKGAQLTINSGNKLRGYGQSFVGRHTLGRLASGALRVSEFAEGSRTGRNIKRSLTALTLGTVDERARRAIFKSGKETKFGGPYSRSDDLAFKKEQSELQSRESRRIKQKNAVKKTKTGTLTKDDIGEIQKMTLDELSKMKQEELKRIAQYLTSKQIDQISDAKPETFTETQKTEIKDERKSVQLKEFKQHKKDGTVDDYFKKQKAEDAAKLDKEILTDVAAVASFTPALLVELEKILTIEARETIANQIKANTTHPAHTWLTTTPRGAQFA